MIKVTLHNHTKHLLLGEVSSLEKASTLVAELDQQFLDWESGGMPDLDEDNPMDQKILAFEGCYISAEDSEAGTIRWMLEDTGDMEVDWQILEEGEYPK